MKTTIVNTLNILFTLVIFIPFVYTQTSCKPLCKNTTGETINIKATSKQSVECVYLINLH